MKIHKFEYEVYYHLYNSTLFLLNLSVCLNNKIDVSYPMKLDEEKIDKYDLNSNYYNDICYTTTTEAGTDIILNDRRDEFLTYNLTICEAECDLISYNDTLEKTTCSCEVKIKIGSFTEIKFDKLILKRRFTNIYSISNFNVMKCSHLVFNKNIIYKNIGFYLITSIIIFGISSLAIFYFKEYNKLKESINKIISDKKGKEKLIDLLEVKNKSKNRNKIKRHRKRMSVMERNSMNLKDSERMFIELQNNSKKSPPIKKNRIKFQDNQNKNKKRHFSFIEANNNILNMLSNNLKNNKEIKENKKKSKKNKEDTGEEKNKNDKKSESNINIEDLTDEEINIMTYEKAKKYDKRTFSIYYISLLRTKHVLIFTFYTKDYNSRIIKIYLLFFTFAMNYTINTLFFDDLNMHQIYKDKGHFNLVYQLPQIIYSSLITIILGAIIKLLALFHENILNIKNSKLENIDKIYKEEIKSIKIKILLFFIITYSLLILFWYYLCCFCSVYKNTQVYLLKDSLCSFLLLYLHLLGYIFYQVFSE